MVEFTSKEVDGDKRKMDEADFFIPVPCITLPSASACLGFINPICTSALAKAYTVWVCLNFEVVMLTKCNNN